MSDIDLTDEVDPSEVNEQIDEQVFSNIRSESERTVYSGSVQTEGYDIDEAIKSLRSESEASERVVDVNVENESESKGGSE